MHKKIFRWLGLGLAVFFILVVLMVVFENYLVYPAPRGNFGDFNHQRLGAEEIWFESADGTQLHGWFFSDDTHQESIVFFHGNGENVALIGPEAKVLSEELNADIFVFDYRGYGKSEGKPNEEGCVADGTAAARWLSQRTGKPSNQIVYLGRSLGGGVALQVSRELKPKALVLVSNFSSMVDVAAATFPWLPVRKLMRNRYESVSAIEDCAAPLWQIHGTEDSIIPIALGEKLHAASPAEHKQFVRAEGLGHNNLPLEDFADEILEFLRAVNESKNNRQPP